MDYLLNLEELKVKELQEREVLNLIINGLPSKQSQYYSYGYAW